MEAVRARVLRSLTTIESEKNLHANLVIRDRAFGLSIDAGMIPTRPPPASPNGGRRLPAATTTASAPGAESPSQGEFRSVVRHICPDRSAVSGLLNT